MVFNNGFDNSLWLILSSDKKYRVDIAEFIYNLPKEVYDSICKQLKDYNYNGKNEDYEFSTIKKLIRGNDGLNGESGPVLRFEN